MSSWLELGVNKANLDGRHVSGKARDEGTEGEKAGVHRRPI